MSDKYIIPFVEATRSCFREVFGEDVQPGKPYLLKRDEAAEFQLSGIIGISGDAKGVVVISLSRRTAQRLTATLTGSQVESLTEDVIDTLGEVVNIIAGNAKKGLEQYRLTISLPSIVQGEDHQVCWPQGVPVVGIPFEMEHGPFLLAVGLENIISLI